MRAPSKIPTTSSSRSAASRVHSERTRADQPYTDRVRRMAPTLVDAPGDRPSHPPVRHRRDPYQPSSSCSGPERRTDDGDPESLSKGRHVGNRRATAVRNGRRCAAGSRSGWVAGASRWAGASLVVSAFTGSVAHRGGSVCDSDGLGQRAVAAVPRSSSSGRGAVDRARCCGGGAQKARLLGREAPPIPSWEHVPQGDSHRNQRLLRTHRRTPPKEDHYRHLEPETGGVADHDRRHPARTVRDRSTDLQPHTPSSSKDRPTANAPDPEQLTPPTTTSILNNAPRWPLASGSQVVPLPWQATRQRCNCRASEPGTK